MTGYLSVEIEGEAVNSAQLITELRDEREELLIDRRGFLLIPESSWDKLQQLAIQHGCQLQLIERSREAA